MSDKPRVPLEEWLSIRRAHAHENLKIQAAEREAKKKLIRRNAIINHAPELADPVNREQLIELIRIMTIELYEESEEVRRSIELKIYNVLWYNIPITLRNAYKKYGQIIIPRSPGFMYKASVEYGQGYDLWVSTDIPNYYEQFTERSVIEKCKPDRLFAIDKLVAKYYAVIRKMHNRETMLAGRFYTVYTRYDLLKRDPVAYEVYVNNKLYQISDEVEKDLEVEFEADND